MIGKFVVRCGDSQLLPHADQRSREHVDLRMTPRVQILQRRIPRRRRHSAAVTGGGSRLAHVNALCGRNRLELSSQAAADCLHVHTVLITSDPRAQNRLRQVVAYVQSEFAPYFLPDARRGAIMDPRIRKERRGCLHALARKGRRPLAENDSDRRLRIEAISLPILTGSHLDQCRQHMGDSDCRCNLLLAVDTVHKAHDRRMLSRHPADALQSPGERRIFQGNDQKLRVIGLLG